MARIVLVEDEPSAMRYLCSVIEQKCSGFEIVDTAENGAEGLEKIRLHKPDIVITDIKMPIIDGIQLVSCIKEELPYIYSIIISGYQDFEYAKGAIQSGVVDYLLKPVNAMQLKDLLSLIKTKLEEQYYTERVAILKNLVAGTPVESCRSGRYLPFKCYNLAILRENGLPSRFSSKQISTVYNPDIDLLVLSGVRGEGHIWAISGRDEMELIFFFTPQIGSIEVFKSFVLEAAGKIKSCYHNIAFSSEIPALNDCKKVVSSLCRIIDNNTIIGRSQIFYENAPSPANNKRIELDASFWNRLNFYLSNAQYDELKQEIIKMFALWEKEQRTQLWVESNLRQILRYVEKHSAANHGAQHHDLEYLLDEALYYAASFGDLMADTWEIIVKLIQHTEVKSQKVDNPRFFSSVELYLEKNLSEALMLQGVCSVFGISQTYLSRLFRKYKNMSFNEYLTTIRVEKAKQLIIENPGMHLKNIAETVGYNDQFYFSRVFRSVTGIPPSEYIKDK